MLLKSRSRPASAGATILPDAPITVEDIANATAMTYPQVYRTTMSGAQLKAVLEDVADNLFNPDPYYQQGGDMVRCGGIGYRIDINQRYGTAHFRACALSFGQEAIDASKDYTVAGWASVRENVEGPSGLGVGRALPRTRADRAY